MSNNDTGAKTRKASSLVEFPAERRDRVRSECNDYDTFLVMCLKHTQLNTFQQVAQREYSKCGTLSLLVRIIILYLLVSTIAVRYWSRKLHWKLRGQRARSGKSPTTNGGRNQTSTHVGPNMECVDVFTNLVRYQKTHLALRKQGKSSL